MAARRNKSQARRNSGNGTREPGVEALDVYSELKNISMFARHERL